MLDRMIQDAFDQMAGTDQPPARVSIADAMRQARAQRRHQRLTAAGAPVLAAATVLAVALTGVIGSPGRSPAARPGNGPLVAPRAFNPLVPYAAATWFPHRIRGISDYSYANALQLDPYGPGQWSSIVVYAAEQCVLTSSRLSCGATANGTRGVMTISGRAPDVGRHAAYWISHVTGDMDIPPGVTMVAFRYATLGWAVVESTGKPADVIRMAANLRFGQTSHLRLPFRLTDLPRSWRDVTALDSSDPQDSWTLILGGGQVEPTGLLRDSLSLSVNVGTGLFTTCDPHDRQHDCRVTTIDGHQVFLTTIPAVDGQPVDYRLTAPNEDGLSVEMDVTGPDAPLSPAEFFAHHLNLLGPDPAHWTTHPLG